MMRKLAAWLAIAAMTLQALWPLVVQAKPSLLVPVCSVGGVTHYVEVPGGTTPADSHADHCQLCFGAQSLALPAFGVAPAIDTFSSASLGALHFVSYSDSCSNADARAPPLLPSVHSNNDNGRNHEKAFALRAARPDVGGSFLRRDVL
jgi:hypothetical protein